MERLLSRIVAVCTLLIVALPGAHAADGATLAQAKARGILRCGVSEGIAGFSAHDESGTWAGIGVDFCRAVAAAALGSPDKVAFVPLRASERFPALREGAIDLLASNTTWTLLREGALGVQFAGVLFYDSQAFMVRMQGAPRTAADLKDSLVCVKKDTTSQDHLVAYSAVHGLNLRPVIVASTGAASAALFSGRCRAWTSDASQLGAARLTAPGGPQSWLIMPERISQEPLGPVVRDDDPKWFVLVRWVLIALVRAEQLGVTRANVTLRSHEATVQAALFADEEVNRNLGVTSGWMLRAVQAAGNYGEMFDRNLGQHSPLGLVRGLNALDSGGGLMAAPPVR
ncbi:amino acid ABC transporter substrate-binding protein [Burkholderia sp. S-53]|uniref:amino acid ABC transporter substrate-binding protein n=1 Tax=Burkholderia sp. S-53 TaxID=2906514 RepID=UPI0021CE5F65|nr:amino acid ABC transporter substrate-binding protein [Burkholderia sp. S-53]UXU86189.1 amino acid ABC transporter substrate-binding protein [Burkholderia sp. S-53]